MKKEVHDLTTEYIRKKFKSNFALANYAIDLAKKHVKEGRPENLSQILAELDALPKDSVPAEHAL